jgi:2-methylcitrate dehydratase PrpD
MAAGPTELLADWIVSCDDDAFPASVRAEGVRSFVNWLGCAVGGSTDIAVTRALNAISPFAGVGNSTVIARDSKLDAMSVALVNGIASHILDFDDTHPETIAHPAGPVVSAALALAEKTGSSGRALLTASIIGIEIECRIATAVCPEHYNAGWHVTGTAGIFGAAAACGRLLGLDARQMTMALGLAATQSSGLREMFASMAKSFHVGGAARNGMLAAILAREDFESSRRAIEGPVGFARVMSTKQDFEALTGELGKRFEAGNNTYKPYACGIVLHPVIDACLELRRKLSPDAIASVDVKVNPQVLALAGNLTPSTGLQGKLSVTHAAAMAFLKGHGAPRAYTDAAVNDNAVASFRRRVHAIPDPELARTTAYVQVTLVDGRKLESFVLHSIGSIERPMSDAQLNEKFTDLSGEILGAPVARRLADLAWKIDAQPDLTGITSLASVPCTYLVRA